MIDGLLSLEVRWFLSGELPEEVQQWFNHDCPGGFLGSEEREDLYLYVPQCEYLNLKLRQGSLEVKWRKAQLGNQQFAGLEGKVERWLKWTCEDSAEHDLVSTATGKAWVEVKKVRSQRSYQGVSYELTQLTVKDSAWWSLAFEALGNLSIQTENFASVVAKVGQSYQGSQLSAQHSFAYPHWISLRF